MIPHGTEFPAMLFLMESFRDWLERQMSDRKLKLADLARDGRINPSSLSRVLTGTRNPGPELCLAIARALDLPPDEVFRQAGLLPDTKKAKDEEELVFYYRQLPEEDQRRILEISRTFYKTNND